MLSTLASLCIILIAVNAQDADYQKNDIQVLNYALTLEHLEYAFYRDGLALFDQTAFSNAGYNSTVYSYFGLIKGHEGDHVAALTQAIQARSGTPVKECPYNFQEAYSSVGAFVATARVLENTGVSAYDGAINRITELDLQTAAATIATIEARHASYLNLLNDQIPFPDAFDPTATPSEIVTTVAPFINLTACDADSVAIISQLNPLVANFTANAPINQTQANLNDVAVLKYALTLEFLEATFYSQGLSNFSNDAFVAAGYSTTVRDYIMQISDHENTHVSALAQTIQAATNMQNEVNACQYNFGYTNVSGFLRIAAILENTGVYAYDGAINAISDLTYKQIAATIATVEGRHAAYLNLISGYESPFPASFDSTLDAATVLGPNGAGGFILPNSCPFDLNQLNFVVANFSSASQNPAPLVPVPPPAATSDDSTSNSPSTSNAGSTSNSNAGSTTNSGSTGSSTGSASNIVVCVALIVAMLAL